MAPTDARARTILQAIEAEDDPKQRRLLLIVFESHDHILGRLDALAGQMVSVDQHQEDHAWTKARRADEADTHARARGLAWDLLKLALVALFSSVATAFSLPQLATPAPVPPAVSTPQFPAVGGRP